MSSTVVENFPDISFIDNTTIEEMRTQMVEDYKKAYKAITGKEVKLGKANPYRLILYTCATQIYQDMQYADFAGKMGFLKYAKGDYLDNLAALRGINRINATTAVTTLEFFIKKPIESDITIPKGTRVSNSNDVYFATDTETKIVAGETSASVMATCTTAGLSGNGFEPGEFKTIVNTLPYIIDVRNIVKTYGGMETEDDDSLRDRAFEIPNTYSVAGPIGAYQYYASRADEAIGSVFVDSEIPGEVDIYISKTDGTLPDEALIGKVSEILNDRTIRPLTDKVIIKSPQETEYDVEITYYVATSDKTAETAIKTNVDAAVSAYNSWQSAKIGRDVNPSCLIQKVMDAGAKRIVVKSPEFAVLEKNTLARVKNVTIHYGGIEDD